MTSSPLGSRTTLRAFIVRLLGIVVFAFATALPADAQGNSYSPSLPDNMLTPADPIGLPPQVSSVGTNETVNLSNGGLTVFIPALSLPQRGGWSVSLGYFSNSLNWSRQQNLSASTFFSNDAPPADGFVDVYQYSEAMVDPYPALQINLPQLEASIEYAGDFKIYTSSAETTVQSQFPVFCMMNWVFTDWSGNKHSFGNVVNCSALGDSEPFKQAPMSTLIQTTDSSDGSWLRLDTTSKSDIHVITKDGTVYHFTDFSDPWPQSASTPYTVNSNSERYYHGIPTSVVDTNNNAVSIANQGGGAYKLTDTLGRTVNIASSGISYTDTNGTARTIALATTNVSTAQPYTFSLSCSYSGQNYQSPYVNPTCSTTGGTNFNLSTFQMTLSFPPSDSTGTSRTYTISFDQLSRIVDIQYPSGGYTKYDYQAQSYAFLMGQINVSGSILEIADKRECTLSSGCTASQELVTTFASTASGLPYNLTMAVTDPTLATTEHVFTNFNLYPQVAPRETYAYYCGSVPAGTQCQAATTLFRTIYTQYSLEITDADLQLPTSITTTLNDASPAISAVENRQYESIAAKVGFGNVSAYIDNPTEIDEYDYGNTTTPLRKTAMVWESSTTGGIYDINARHLLDRIESQTVTDPNTSNQETTSYGRDTLGNITSKSVGGTGVTTLTTNYIRDAYGNITQATDPRGKVTKYGYSDTWAQSTCAPASNSSAYVTSITDALNHVSNYSYDSCSGLKASATDPNSQETTYTYDALQRLDTVTAPDGGTTTNTYVDALPNSITVTSSITPSLNHIQKTVLDGFERTIQTQLTSDPDGTVFVDTAYDPVGRKYCVSNPYRSTSNSTYGITTYKYDPLSRVTQLQPPDYWTSTPSSSPTCQTVTPQTTPANPSNNVTTAYSGNVTTATDEAGKQRSTTTDALGRLTIVDEPGNTVTVPATSSTGTVTITGTEDCASGQCDQGTVSIWVDGFERTVNYGSSSTTTTIASALASALTTSGSPVTAAASGSDVNMTSVATGSTTNYTFTSSSTSGAPFHLANPSFKGTPSSGHMSGGANATVQPGTGPLTMSTPYQTLYTYDAFSNLLTTWQTGSRQRIFVYNTLNQLTGATNPESGTITYTYDNDGNVSMKTVPAQNQTGTATVTLTYCYDALNRLTAKGYTSQTCTGATMPSPVATYWYDGTAPTSPSGCTPTLTATYPIYRRTAMCDAAGWEAWSYNKTGHLIDDRRSTNSLVRDTIYVPNLDGSDASITYPITNRVITYTPGGAGLPLSASDGTTTYVSPSAHYAPQGTLASLTNNGNIYSTFIYNSRLQPCWTYATTNTALAASTACTATDSTVGTVLDVKYSFNLGAGNNGNVFGITNNRDTTRSQVFVYDPLNRIQTAGTVNTSGTNCWGETYGIDAWANLSSLALPSSYSSSCSHETPFSYTIPNSNQLPSASGFTYDAAGNLMASGLGNYVYNAENQMTSVTVASTTTTYSYDGDGKRVEKSGGKIYWYGGGSDALDETDLSGNTNNSTFSEYVFFDGKRTARRDYQSNVFYYFSDHLGTSREMVQAGQTSACYDADFYPYGGEITHTTTCTQNYKFTEKERDQESDLDEFISRYYSSSQVRFISPDDYNIVIEMQKGRDTGEQAAILTKYLSNPQLWNKYAYVLNNPLSNTDPDGRRALTAGDYAALQKLLDYASENPDAASAVSAAINALISAINAVPDGGTDPIGLKVALYSATQLGNNSFGFRGSVSFNSNGMTISVGDGKWKCNIFLAQAYAEGGGIGLGGNGYPVNGRYLGLGSIWGSVNAESAETLANPNASVPNFPTANGPGVGDIVAFQAPPSELAHSTINLGGGTLIYAGENGVKIGTVGQNQAGHIGVTYRTYKP